MKFSVGISSISMGLIVLVSLLGCKKDSISDSLKVTPMGITIAADGGSSSFTITTDASSWSIQSSGSWVKLSSTSGATGDATVTLSVTTRSTKERTDTLTITAGSASPQKIVIKQQAAPYEFALTTDPSNLAFAKAGGSFNLNVTTDAAQWTLTSDVDWLQVDTKSGVKGTTPVKVSAAATVMKRSGTITITAANAPTVTIAIGQDGDIYPSYNTSPAAPDATGMSSDAMTLASNIHLGWNIGNTLEAIGGETAWGNPMVSKSLIDLVKASGFNAIRIPCSWYQYMANSATAEIKASWLERVKEVVQYCVDNNMYVILNIHWDGGWLEKNCTTDKKAANNAMQKAFWEQIATKMRDFDEHLILASANEPDVSDATQMAVLMSYHQTFIDAVRSTGGKNSYRVLLVQGPSTDIEKTNTLMTSMPTDNIANKLMVEVHYYNPWNFCGLTQDETWGKMFYYWGKDYHSATDAGRNATYGEESNLDSFFSQMHEKFVKKGIPVVIGEFSPVRRSSLTGDALKLHLNSRAHYLKYLVRSAKANGLLPFYWDNGGMDNNSSGIFNRKDNTVFDQQAVDSLVAGLK